jgi:hypothetical protein
MECSTLEKVTFAYIHAVNPLKLSAYRHYTKSEQAHYTTCYRKPEHQLKVPKRAGNVRINIILKRVRVTIVVVEKQYVIHI